MQKEKYLMPHYAAIFLIIIITAATYFPVVGNDFINFDDNLHVTANEFVLKGLSIKSFEYALTDTRTGNFHPITWLSHMLDVSLFGLNPAGHHLTSLIFHIINSALVYFLFVSTTSNRVTSFFIALLFSIHPLHIESVAWVSERKDVLCSFFWLITMLQYFRYVKSQSHFNYLLIIVLFLMGYFSKAMIVTLPFVLLIFDYWPLYRFRLNNEYTDKQPMSGIKKESFFTLVWEKIPLFILTFFLCIITYLIQQNSDAVKSLDDYSIWLRLCNSLVAYIRYLFKMFYPIDLAILYPHLGMPPIWQVSLASLFLIVFSLFCFRMRSARPWLLAGWLWYLCTLLPVIGLVQVGHQSIADRYTYMPSIGIFILIVYGTYTLYNINAHTKYMYWIFISITIFLMMSLSSRYIIKWKNSISIYNHSISVTTDNSILHYNIGNSYFSNGNIEKAIFHYIEAIKINNKDVHAYNNLGNVLLKTGNIDEAEKQYRNAIYHDSSMWSSYNNLGVVLSRQGKTDESIRYIRESIKIKPDYLDAHENLGYIYLNESKYRSALIHFNILITFHPTCDSIIFYNIAKIYDRLNHPQNAAMWFTKAIERGFNNWKRISSDFDVGGNRFCTYYSKIFSENIFPGKCSDHNLAN